MPPPSPLTENSDLTSFAILANGSALDGTYQIFAMRIVNALNRIPYARIELVDGDAAAGDFPISASSDLAPGTPLEVQLGYEGTNQTVFSGVVTRQTIRQQGGGSVLMVEASDNAVKMTIGRRSALYSNTTDSSVLTQLIQNSGLTAQVASTDPTLTEITQYYASDWDFLLTRAEANGMVVAVENGTVNVLAPDFSASPVLSLTYGADVLSFQLEEDASSQLQSVSCSAWDYQNQQLVQAQANISNANALGSPPSTTLAGVVSPSVVQFQSSAAWTQQSLTAWANGLILRSELAKIRGQLQFQGSALVSPGTTVLLAGFGTRFNGTAFVSGVTHEVDEGVWTTTAEIGFDGTVFAEQVQVSAPAAGGLLPGVTGLQNGTVTQIDQDPGGAFRVLVQIPVVGTEGTGVWARLASPYASNQAGIFFFPEIGDEVILGFINDDPSVPVILGSLYSGSKKVPPYTPDANNTIKAVVTLGNLQLKLDDQNNAITLVTPGNQSLMLSDQENGQIVLQDQTGNKITLSSSGIEISSAKSLTLTAQTDVTITASGGNLSMSASSGKLSGSALSVAFSADSEFTASGNGKAALQASGEVAITGGLVKIN